MAKNKKVFIRVDEDLCDGCRICIDYCKNQVFGSAEEINNHGVYVTIPIKSSDCKFCRFCQFVCPQLAIYAEKHETTNED